MNAAECMVDVHDMFRQADALELEALRLEDSTTQRRRIPGLYERSRNLRAQAVAMEARIESNDLVLKKILSRTEPSC